jgi:hypothetical protein
VAAAIAAEPIATRARTACTALDRERAMTMSNEPEA